ncbi:uncharacterized protein LOC131642531 [Vicia villosa]|uniref:uncharacterized protein LOC131642531 n=1 Tax=Vicia villosa TaxID=3911 RepID=UPI00273B0BA5|nr:uncharacterized protein LOC131642531 [Vicia villosa]
MNDPGNDWVKVNRKGRNAFTSIKWDIFKNPTVGVRGDITLFFITDFEQKWGARDLFFEFKNLGVVDEIVIPPKKDWRGQKYGFVRFVKVEDIRLLEIKLDNFWLDGRKLKANVSKFKRKVHKGSNEDVAQVHVRTGSSVSRGPIQKGDNKFVRGNGNGGGNGGGTTNAFRKHSLTYAESVKHNEPDRFFPDIGEVPKQKPLNPQNPLNNCKTGEASILEASHKTFFYSSKKEETDRFQKAMVGVSKAAGMAYGVSKILLEEGIFSVVATPLGPNLCLLEEKTEGDLKLLLRDAGDWKDRWFKEVRKWTKKDVECVRAVWVSIYGIPCFVRNRRFCEILLSDIGVVVNGEELEGNQIRMDVTNVMVFTNQIESINRKIVACVDGEMYSILVKEDVMVRAGDLEEVWSESVSSEEETVDSESMAERESVEVGEEVADSAWVGENGPDS